MKTPHQLKIQAERLQFASMRLEEAGIDILSSSSEYQLQFMHLGHKVYFFPHSGWHSGSKIIDGRGLENLIKQIV